MTKHFSQWLYVKTCILYYPTQPVVIHWFHVTLLIYKFAFCSAIISCFLGWEDEKDTIIGYMGWTDDVSIKFVYTYIHSLSANWRFCLIALHCRNHKEDIKHEITFQRRASKDKSPPACLFFLLLLKDEELIMMMNNELKSSSERYGNLKVKTVVCGISFVDCRLWWQWQRKNRQRLALQLH